MTDRKQDLPDDLIPTDHDDDDIIVEDFKPTAGKEIDPDSVRPAPGVDEDGNAIDVERIEDILKGE